MWTTEQCPDCGGYGAHKYGPSVEPQAELCERCWGLGTILETSDQSDRVGGRATDEVEAILCATWTLLGSPATSSRDDIIAWAEKFARALWFRGIGDDASNAKLAELTDALAERRNHVTTLQEALGTLLEYSDPQHPASLAAASALEWTRPIKGADQGGFV